MGLLGFVLTPLFKFDALVWFELRIFEFGLSKRV